MNINQEQLNALDSAVDTSWSEFNRTDDKLVKLLNTNLILREDYEKILTPLRLQAEALEALYVTLVRDGEV